MMVIDNNDGNNDNSSYIKSWKYCKACAGNIKDWAF